MCSVDNGRTWGDPVSNVPRRVFTHKLPDDQLFELDEVGVVDPNDPETAVFWGAWSFPNRLGDTPQRDFVRIHLPSIKSAPLTEHLSGYPTHHWWPLWNSLHGSEELAGAEIRLAGFSVTDGITLDDGRLLALGYGCHKGGTVSSSVADPFDAGNNCIFTIESIDNGRTWTETGVAADGIALDGWPNEATLVRLRDGRLYSAMRYDGVATVLAEGALHQMWSSDDGRTWATPEPVQLIDSDHIPASVWPRTLVLEDGTLIMTYGRPGKHVICDPSGTGTEWQSMLDLTAFEKETQSLLGVPESQQIQRRYDPAIRHWDSSDYLAVATDGPRCVIVMYDVQNYIENWNAAPVSAVRMLRVRVED